MTKSKIKILPRHEFRGFFRVHQMAVDVVLHFICELNSYHCFISLEFLYWGVPGKVPWEK